MFVVRSGAPRALAAGARAASTSAAPARRRFGTATKGAVALAGGTLGYHYLVADLRSSGPYRWLVTHVVMPALRTLDPETAHGLAVRSAAAGLAPVDAAPPSPLLATTLWGLPFPSPVGLAAGFDKHAEAVEGLLGAGFGFVEIGSVTPLPQPGNPKPRMFRLPEDGAVINRYGFNSEGKEAAAGRLAAFWRRHGWRVAVPGGASTSSSSSDAGDAAAAREALARIRALAAPPRGLVGVNLGKNKEGDAKSDYVAGVNALAPYADYLVVNVSSPNTPGLRSLQGRAQLTELLGAVKAARDAIPWGSRPPVSTASGAGWRASTPEEANLVFLRARPPPLLVKIAPDVSEDDLQDIAAVVTQSGIDGIIATNTTVARPPELVSVHKGETGGLSGRPLKDASTAVIRRVYELTGGRVPIVGVGGVESGADAYAKIRAGASVVQLYSALVYGGPCLASDIKTELAALLAADGYTNASQAVGADVRAGAAAAAKKPA